MSHEEQKTSTAMSLPKKETQPPNPEKVEATTKASVNEITDFEDEDEELLLDEGGDFFWLLQNVVWGTLKSLFIIVVLVAIIWIIWGKATPKQAQQHEVPVQTQPSPQQTESPQNTSKEPSWLAKLFTSEEKNDVPVEQPDTEKENIPASQEVVVEPIATIPQKATDIPVSDITSWNMYLEEKRLFEVNQSYFQGVNWLQRAQNVYAIPLPQHITGQNEYERQLSLNDFLNYINELLQESISIRSTIFTAKQDAAQKAAIANQQIQQTQATISNVLNQRANQNLPTLVSQKAEFGKTYTFNNTNDQIYGWMIQSMETYDRSLREIYEIIYANQAAIAKDVRVVNFPTDPFQRVISPAQWRSGQ